MHLFLLFCVCLGSYAVPCLLMRNPRYVLLRLSLKSCLRIVNYLETEAQVLMNFQQIDNNHSGPVIEKEVPARTVTKLFGEKRKNE